MVDARTAIVLPLMVSLFLAWGTCPAAEASEDIKALLLDAVKKDDDLAYTKARERALRLPDKEFSSLLDGLAQEGAWQAMAIRDGLKLRREQPLVAKEFDDRLTEIIENPITRRDGSKRYLTRTAPGVTIRGLMRKKEHDSLRFEACLTQKVKVESQPSVPGPERDSLRASLLGLSNDNPANMARYVAMLRDVPKWTTAVRVSSGIASVAQWSPGSVDAVLPQLIEAYRKLRQEANAEQMQAARRLVLAINRAAPNRRETSLDEIRKFERETMPKQGLEPWTEGDQLALFQKDRDNTRKLAQARHLLEIAKNEKKGQTEIRKLEEAVRVAEKEAAISSQQRAALSLWNQLEKAASGARQPATREQEGD